MKLRKIQAATWTALAFSLLTPVYLEVALHLCIYKQMSGRIVYPILFALTAGILLFALCACLPRRAGSVVLCVLLGLMTLYFEVQLVYNSIFGEFMSLMQLFTGAAAVTNFFRQMLYGIWRILPLILLLLLPEAAAVTLTCLKRLRTPRLRWYWLLTLLALFFAVHFGTVGIMAAGGKGAYTVYGLYTNRNTGTEISVNNIGLLSTTRLEGKYLLFPQAVVKEDPPSYAAAPAPKPAAPEEPDRETVYNVLDLDFEALAASTEDQALQNLDRYFAAQTPTAQNEYTGLLKDCNLITICAESFSPLLIDEERTPALYKLSTGGFVFRNYFGTYGSNTTNGEYTFCMGNYPDMSRSKAAASFFASQNNYLPFTLGNEFSALGVQTWAYHNYSGEYYSRRDTHPNMGYTFQSAGDGLDIEINWPSSDLEMMEASVDDYLSDGLQFHAYYMTFSGHYQYDWDNPMSAKNRAVTDGLPYSETVKAYIACNQELEYALEYLLDRLEEAGAADNTVIVLTNDHYPYGLTDQQYDELAGHHVDTVFEKYRNSFICYVPGMEPVAVDTYCSTADILPTLLNLFGLPYDSRLLAGRDVLSDGASGMAVLSDQSFVTADYGFDAAAGQVTVFTEGYTVDEADLAQRQAAIQNQFQASLDVLNHDYYAHAFPDGSEAAAPKQEIPFTDLAEWQDPACVVFLCGSGYMDPASATKFGGGSGTYAEFLDVLYRMEGSPNMDNTWVYMGSTRQITGKYVSAVKWASRQKLSTINAAEMSSYTPVTRADAAVTLMRYAQARGLDTSVEDPALLEQMTKAHPEFTAEEAHALHWCYNNLIIRGWNGKILSIMEDNPDLSRYDMAHMIYQFYQYILEDTLG